MRGSCAGASGITDIPMQLVIGACVIAFAAPIFYSAYGDISENLATQRVERSIQDLMEVMELVLSGDDGSRMRSSFSIEGSGSCSIDVLKIGGPLDESPDKYIIEYSLSTGISKKFSLDPPFAMTGPSMEGLELGNGDHDLWVELMDREGSSYLLISSG